MFGRPIAEPLAIIDSSFRNRDLMWAPAHESRAQIVDAYRRACRHADDTMDSLDAEALGTIPWWGEDPVPLFNVMTHMLGETRQHLGHMDLIRERIDGRVGNAVELPSQEHSVASAHHWQRVESAARRAAGRATDDADGAADA